MNKNAKFTGRWSKCEIERFEQAASFGNLCWSEIAEFVGTRTAAQCRSHHQKMTISKRIKETKTVKPKKSRINYDIYMLLEKETQCETPSITSSCAPISEKDTCETLTPKLAQLSLPPEIELTDLINLSPFHEIQPEDFFDCLKF